VLGLLDIRVQSGNVCEIVLQLFLVYFIENFM